MLYASFLSAFMLASSISAYLQAVILFHVLEGHTAPSLSGRQLKATLAGMKNKQAVAKRQKDPIQVNQLLLMYKKLDLSSDLHILFWAPALLLFRTLLRVSHVTKSTHTLRMCDFVAAPWGLLLTIRSSKVSKTYEKNHSIPVSTCEDHRLCPVYWLRKSSEKRELIPYAPAYAIEGGQPLSYYVFMNTMKGLQKKAAVVGDLASHSFRRGGATLMSSLDCYIAEIKARGRWSSDCVFEYVKPTLSDELSTDFKLSSYCAEFNFKIDRFGSLAYDKV